MDCAKGRDGLIWCLTGLNDSRDREGENFRCRPVSNTLLSKPRVLSFLSWWGENFTLGRFGKRFLLGNFTFGALLDLMEFRFWKLSLRMGSILPIRFGFDGLIRFEDLSLSFISLDLLSCCFNLDREFVRLGLTNLCCSCIFSVVGFGLDRGLDLNLLLVLVGALVEASVVSIDPNRGAIENLDIVRGLVVTGSWCCFSVLGLGFLRMGIFLFCLVTALSVNDVFSGLAVVTKLFCRNRDRPRVRTLFLGDSCFVVSST